MTTMEPSPRLMDPDVSAVHGGVASVGDIKRRLTPYFERAEPRPRAMASLRGLLRSTERKNSWQLAAVTGEATPEGFQHLVCRALWEPQVGYDELRCYVIQPLGDPHGVLVINETGVSEKRAALGRRGPAI